MVNNLKQLSEMQRTSIIRLIKQEALIKKNILSVSYNKNKVNFISKYQNRKFLLESALKSKKIGIVPSLIFTLLFNLIPT